jgi:uncharacterized protein (TIGR02266 family)
LDFRNVERRAHARVGASIVVRIANADGTFDEFITKDVSMGGVFVHTDRPRSLGEQLDLLICFTDGLEEVAVLGQVARIVGFEDGGIPGPKGMGIRFIIVEPKQKEQLEQFLDSLLELTGAGSREHQRVKARLKVNLKKDGKGKAAMLENISKGGVYLETDENFQIQDRIEVILVHPQTDEQVEVVGEVIHKRESLDIKTNVIYRGVGLRFIELYDDKNVAIKRFIKSMVDSLPA